MDDAALSRDLKIQGHPDVYPKKTKIVEIIFNCLLHYNIRIGLCIKKCVITSEMVDMIFNMVISLVKKLDNQLAFADFTNKKASGLVNHIVIGDLYVLVKVMCKSYQDISEVVLFNDENKKVRQTQISFMLASLWKISMTCKNIFLMDVPFHMIGRLIYMEGCMSILKVDVNKITKLKITRDILTMIFITNECDSNKSVNDALDTLCNSLSSRRNTNKLYSWAGNCQFDLFLFLFFQQEYVVKRMKELLDRPNTKKMFIN